MRRIDWLHESERAKLTLAQEAKCDLLGVNIGRSMNGMYFAQKVTDVGQDFYLRSYGRGVSSEPLRFKTIDEVFAAAADPSSVGAKWGR